MARVLRLHLAKQAKHVQGCERARQHFKSRADATDRLSRPALTRSAVGRRLVWRRQDAPVVVPAAKQAGQRNDATPGRVQAAPRLQPQRDFEVAAPWRCGARLQRGHQHASPRRPAGSARRGGLDRSNRKRTMKQRWSSQRRRVRSSVASDSMVWRTVERRRTSASSTKPRHCLCGRRSTTYGAPPGRGKKSADTKELAPVARNVKRRSSRRRHVARRRAVSRRRRVSRRAVTKNNISAPT
jgi:hypothetical protein